MTLALQIGITRFSIQVIKDNSLFNQVLQELLVHVGEFCGWSSVIISSE